MSAAERYAIMDDVFSPWDAYAIMLAAYELRRWHSARIAARSLREWMEGGPRGAAAFGMERLAKVLAVERACDERIEGEKTR